MLRILTLSTALVAFGCAGSAQTSDPEPEVQFAPGALGDLGVNVDDLMSEARKSGEALRETLQTQAPADLGEMTPGLEALQERAMNDPRVRELLGLRGDDATAAVDSDRPKYDETKIVIFASFAMPAPSLQKVMAVLRGLDDSSCTLGTDCVSWPTL